MAVHPPTCYNVRGTSGSGKSTMVREIMSAYKPSFQKIMRVGRKRPIRTIHQHVNGGRELAILGHYEAACGGCDTINELDDVFELVRKELSNGRNVLFEGLILSGEIIRTDILVRESPTQIFCLTTPVDKCIAHVGDRREARGADRLFNHKNTIAKARCVELTMKRLEATFALPEVAIQSEARWGSYDDVHHQIRSLLDV